MSGNSLHRRDIKRMSQLEKRKRLTEYQKHLSELDRTWKYQNIDELDEKELIEYFKELEKRWTLYGEIMVIKEVLRHRRVMAKASARALENKRKREEFEARERERIRNLPPIDQEELARMQKTWAAYTAYIERGKRLKREVTY